MDSRSYLSGKRVAVIGLARTGAALAPVLLKAGACVTVYDRRHETELLAEAEAVRQAGARAVLGDERYPGVEDADLVVPSPGVPADAPVLVAARRAGAEVVPEIEVAYLLSCAPIIAITGTNGKTTTTAMAAAMLSASGVRAHHGGNMAPGEPLIVLASRAAPDDVIVAEVSSFQLELCTRFRPRVAVVTNISQDHLNRHRTLEAYAAAKSRIFVAQQPGDLAITNAECPISAGLSFVGRGRHVRFSALREVDAGAWVRAGRIVLRLRNEEELVSVDEMPLRGQHNVENAMAAAIAARAMGATPDGIRAALRSFRGVVHRMEEVCTAGDVLYINNSMCTNPEALRRSVEACDRPVVLIAGGRNKSLDFRAAAARVAELVKGAVLIGEMAEELADLLRGGGLARVATARGMEEAVSLATSMASPGDAVMLAPGCASMDMYNDFMERGEAFRAVALALPGAQPICHGGCS